jgi:hypothetical protein
VHRGVVQAQALWFSTRLWSEDELRRRVLAQWEPTQGEPIEGNGAATIGAATNGAATNGAATNGAATNGAATTAQPPTAQPPTAQPPTAQPPTAQPQIVRQASARQAATQRAARQRCIAFRRVFFSSFLLRVASSAKCPPATPLVAEGKTLWAAPLSREERALSLGQHETSGTLPSGTLPARPAALHGETLSTACLNSMRSPAARDATRVVAVDISQVVLVEDGCAVVYQFSDATVEDPAQWLDLSAFTVHEVHSLGEVPATVPLLRDESGFDARDQAHRP